MLVSRLLELRRAIPALTLGSYQSIEQENVNCFVYLRQHDDQRYMIVLNFSDREQVLALSRHTNGEIALSTFMDREGFVDLSEIHLRANEGMLINVGEV